MKIICEKQHEAFLKEKFEAFELLPVTLVQDSVSYDYPAITFHINQWEEVLKILENYPLKNDFVGEKNGRLYPLKLSDILLVEAYTKDTFAYTHDDYYKIFHKINDLEIETNLVRISRTMLVNMSAVKYLVPTLASKLILHLSNDMEVEVNRAYVKEIKNIFGMKVKP